MYYKDLQSKIEDEDITNFNYLIKYKFNLDNDILEVLKNNQIKLGLITNGSTKESVKYLV